jgi:anti-anti-sigma factor
MRIATTQVQGRVPLTILEVDGELDATTYQELIAQARDACDNGARDLLLDLGGVPFLSSAGLMALHSIAAMLRRDESADGEVGRSSTDSVSADGGGGGEGDGGGQSDSDQGFQPHFKLLNPQPKVAQTLDLVGFNLFLEIYTDRETAIASF